MRNLFAVDFESQEKFASGRACFQAPEIDGQIIIEESVVEPGQIIPIKITRAMEYDLIGRTPN